MKLILGDCIRELESIPNNSVDMVLSDLPYGTTKNRWDKVIQLDRLWEQLRRVCKLCCSRRLHLIKRWH